MQSLGRAEEQQNVVEIIQFPFPDTSSRTTFPEDSYKQLPCGQSCRWADAKTNSLLLCW